jgi:hypothetical protein
MALPALLAGHHSFAVFDQTRTVALTGVVQVFAWTNPHAWITVEVRNDRAGVDLWTVEMGSPNSLARQGWTRSVVKPGDRVTVLLNPLKSGEPVGHLVSLTLPDGRVLAERRTLGLEDDRRSP